MGQVEKGSLTIFPPSHHALGLLKCKTWPTTRSAFLSPSKVKKNLALIPPLCSALGWHGCGLVRQAHLPIVAQQHSGAAAAAVAHPLGALGLNVLPWYVVTWASPKPFQHLPGHPAPHHAPEAEMARQRVEDDKIIAAYQAKRQAAERPPAKALRGKKMQPAASAESDSSKREPPTEEAVVRRRRKSANVPADEPATPAAAQEPVVICSTLRGRGWQVRTTRCTQQVICGLAALMWRAGGRGAGGRR